MNSSKMFSLLDTWGLYLYLVCFHKSPQITLSRAKYLPSNYRFRQSENYYPHLIHPLVVTGHGSVQIEAVERKPPEEEHSPAMLSYTIPGIETVMEMHHRNPLYAIQLCGNFEGEVFQEE